MRAIDVPIILCMLQALGMAGSCRVTAPFSGTSTTTSVLRFRRTLARASLPSLQCCTYASAIHYNLLTPRNLWRSPLVHCWLHHWHLPTCTAQFFALTCYMIIPPRVRTLTVTFLCCYRRHGRHWHTAGLVLWRRHGTTRQFAAAADLARHWFNGDDLLFTCASGLAHACRVLPAAYNRPSSVYGLVNRHFLRCRNVAAFFVSRRFVATVRLQRVRFTVRARQRALRGGATPHPSSRLPCCTMTRLPWTVVCSAIYPRYRFNACNRPSHDCCTACILPSTVVPFCGSSALYAYRDGASLEPVPTIFALPRSCWIPRCSATIPGAYRSSSCWRYGLCHFAAYSACVPRVPSFCLCLFWHARCTP